MQANQYGFNMSAHPCTNGTCDAISQCKYDMMVEGEATYGAGAYGPGGSRIDTNSPFTVKTEFISDKSYATLHKIRTRITQSGNEIVMEASCEDYLTALNDDIEGGMGFILSSWDNTDASLDAGQYAAQCSTPAASCADATSQISDFTVFQWGYTEDIDVTPAPEPTPPDPSPAPAPTPTPIEPADFQMFIGQSS